MQWKWIVNKAQSFKSSKRLITKKVNKNRVLHKECGFACGCNKKKWSKKVVLPKKVDVAKKDLKVLEKFRELVSMDNECDTPSYTYAKCELLDNGFDLE